VTLLWSTGWVANWQAADVAIWPRASSHGVMLTCLSLVVVVACESGAIVYRKLLHQALGKQGFKIIYAVTCQLDY